MVGVRFLRFSLSVLLLLGFTHIAASDYNFNLYLGLGPVKIAAGTAHLYDTEVIYNGRDAISFPSPFSRSSIIIPSTNFNLTFSTFS